MERRAATAVAHSTGAAATAVAHGTTATATAVAHGTTVIGASGTNRTSPLAPFAFTRYHLAIQEGKSVVREALCISNFR